MVLPCLSFACIRDSDPTGGVPYKERVTEYIKNADYIFLGRIDAREWKRNPDWQNENPWHYNKISVIEQFKGSLNSPIDIGLLLAVTKHSAKSENILSFLAIWQLAPFSFQ